MRYKLKEKSVYGRIMSGGRFWEDFSFTLSKKYDLSQIGKIIVGNDGAPWVKKGADMLGSLYELDRFHLKRALHRGLDSDTLVAEVYQACITGEIDSVDRLLTGAQEKAAYDGLRVLRETKDLMVMWIS